MPDPLSRWAAHKKSSGHSQLRDTACISSQSTLALPGIAPSCLRLPVSISLHPPPFTCVCSAPPEPADSSPLGPETPHTQPVPPLPAGGTFRGAGSTQELPRTDPGGQAWRGPWEPVRVPPVLHRALPLSLPTSWGLFSSPSAPWPPLFTTTETGTSREPGRRALGL